MAIDSSKGSISISPHKAPELDLQFSKEEIKWSQGSGRKLIGEIDVEFEGKTYTIKLENIDDVSRGGEILMEQAKRVLLLAIAAKGPIKVTGQNFEYLETGTAKITDKKVDVSWTGAKSYIGEGGDLNAIKTELEKGRAAISKLGELSKIASDNHEKIDDTGVTKSNLRDVVLGSVGKKPKSWEELEKDDEKAALAKSIYGGTHYEDKTLKGVIESLHQQFVHCNGDMDSVEDELKSAEARYSQLISGIASIVSNPSLFGAQVKVHKTFWENVKGTFTPSSKAGDKQKPQFAENADKGKMDAIDQLYQQALNETPEGAKAALKLGKELSRGEDSLLKNYDKAEHFLEQAAAHGEAHTKFEAEYQLAKVRQAKIAQLPTKEPRRELEKSVKEYFERVDNRALSGLAKSMFDSKDPVEKQEAFEILVQLEEAANQGEYRLSNDDYEILIHLYQSKGNQDEADGLLDKWINQFFDEVMENEKVNEIKEVKFNREEDRDALNSMISSLPKVKNDAIWATIIGLASLIDSKLILDENLLIVAKQLVKITPTQIEAMNKFVDEGEDDITDEAIKNEYTEKYNKLIKRLIDKISNKTEIEENENRALINLIQLLKDKDTPVEIKLEIGEELKKKYVAVSAEGNKKQSIKKIMSECFEGDWENAALALKVRP